MENLIERLCLLFVACVVLAAVYCLGAVTYFHCTHTCVREGEGWCEDPGTYITDMNGMMVHIPGGPDYRCMKCLEYKRDE